MKTRAVHKKWLASITCGIESNTKTAIKAGKRKPKKTIGSVHGKTSEVDFGIDEAYYLYVVKLRMSEQDFWRSPLRKINFILNMYTNEIQARYGMAEVEEQITSMKQIPGW